MDHVGNSRSRKTLPGLPVSLLGAGIAAVYLLAILTPPEAWLDGSVVPQLSLEALALVPVLLLARVAGGRGSRWLLWGLGAVLLVLFMLSIGNAILLRTFDRPLDIPLDLHLAPALLEVGADALGMGQPWLWLGGGLAAAAIVGLANVAALTVLARVRAGDFAFAFAVAAMAAAAAHALTAPGGRCGAAMPLDCQAIRVAGHQLTSALDVWRPMPEFDRALADDEFSYPNADRPLLTRIRDNDVLLVFIESYGTSALQDARYASDIVPRLRRIEAELGDEGFFTASGTLVAPTVGGLSWLSHGTLLSGVWVDNHRLYRRLIASERRTLVHMFADAGHRTVGIFPQMLQPWPEGQYFGYDQIWTSLNIEYSGPRFGWTTMPDQYTLWFLQSKELQAPDPRPPLFAEVALISSHAPWEPVPEMVAEWEALGTGEAFSGMVEPEWDGPEGWPEEAPRNYTRTILYSLDAVAGFASRFAGDDTLLIVLGDHEPAPLITGGNVDWNVPVHVITRDRRLLQPFVEWGFETSMLPSLERDARRMDVFRDWFVQAFSEPAASRDVPRRPE